MKLASGGMAKYYTSFVFKSDASVQAELVSCYRRRPVFWRLSNEMSERSHCVHSVQMLQPLLHIKMAAVQNIRLL